MENNINYTPNYKSLEKRYGTFNNNPFFKLFESKSNYFGEQVISEDRFLQIEEVLCKLGIDENHPDFYWIVNQIPSHAYLVGMTKMSHSSKTYNKEHFDVFDLINSDKLKGLSFITSTNDPLKVKDPRFLTWLEELIINNLNKSPLFQNEYIVENRILNKNKLNFVKAEKELQVIAFNNFLVDRKIKTARVRHLIIGKLFSIADLPFETNVGGKRVPINALGPFYSIQKEKEEEKKLVDAVNACLSRAS